MAWTDPSPGGAIDRVTGQPLTQTIYEAILADLLALGGTAGLIHAAALAADVKPAILATPTITGLLTLTGGQIAFPAAQSASADPNTLDDYEEGTWTPSLFCDGGGTATLSAGVWVYTKVGRQVTINGFLLIDTVVNPLGRLWINGLPFAPSYDAGVAMSSYAFKVGAITALQAYVSTASGAIAVDRFNAGTGMWDLASFLQTGTEMHISATYLI